jgi:Sec-independent protein secretion pathway component TatC
VITQFMMALPLMALYEISILIAKVAGKKKRASETNS